MLVEAIVDEIRDRIGVWRPLPTVTFRLFARSPAAR